MYFVYVLRLHNGDYYTGFTENINQCFAQHRQHIVSATKKMDDPTLTFYAAFETKKRALNFEKYLKSSSGFAFRNKRLI